MTTEVDRELLEKFEIQQDAFTIKMIECRIQYLSDKNNDYYLFIYLASIMDFIEGHNGGCLTEVGMMSLRVDISPILDKLIANDENDKISQKDLVKMSLNLLNSYALCILTKGLFEFAKQEPEAFFKLNDFPNVVKEDFDELNERVTDMHPKLKVLLDKYTPYMDKEHKKIFTEEKQNGFFKQIFTAESVKTSGLQGVQNARECK